MEEAEVPEAIGPEEGDEASSGEARGAEAADPIVPAIPRRRRRRRGGGGGGGGAAPGGGGGVHRTAPIAGSNLKAFGRFLRRRRGERRRRGGGGVVVVVGWGDDRGSQSQHFLLSLFFILSYFVLFCFFWGFDFSF